MNETKKILTILIIAVVALIGVLAINFVNSKENDKKLKEYELIKNSHEAKLVYIARPTCSYCQQFEPVLKEITSTYGLKYEYINTDALAEGLLTKVLKLFNTDTSTPQLLVVKDGKVLNNNQGYTDRAGLFKFLQDNEIVSKDEVLEQENSHLTMIDYNKYNELITTKEDKIIVIGQKGCSHCETAKPVLNMIAKENNIEINYLDLTAVSEADQKEMFNSLDIFSKEFGTPLTMVVNDKKVVKSIQGFESKEKHIQFFKDTKFIK